MKRFIWLLFIAGVGFNCGGETGTAGEESATTEQEETPMGAEKKAEATAAAVLNPNLASREELTALPQVDEALAQKIQDGRPYLNMKDFKTVLSGAVEESEMEALLTACFVPLNLNTASEEELLMVPGVGQKMAHEFEEYRPYRKVAQFRREMGKYVDEAEIARYEKYVFVPVELNTAADEEILAIPGVGDRMLHEFKEYRPYQSLEQFRREIGKYVDDQELARLERFVYLEEAN